MRIFLCGAYLFLLVAGCLTPATGPDPGPLVWQPPPAPETPNKLRIEPARIALSLGDSTALRIRGVLANDASCTWNGGASDGPHIRLFAREPGPLEVLCTAEGREARAQVTVTRARELPQLDPYSGGVVLFKLRRTPRDDQSPVGRQSLGMDSLDVLLRRYGAHAFPAFPFDLSRTKDRVGLSRWIIVDIPETVNFYQAVEDFRADSYIYPESYLPEDAHFIRVPSGEDWPVSFVEPKSPERVFQSRIQPAAFGGGSVPGAVTWDLEQIGAPAAWHKGQGSGVGIAIVDTGVDLNHLAISPNVPVKSDEYAGFDGDGNGIPGDGAGVNLAHLAIVHDGEVPRLALGMVWNVADWGGLESRLVSRSFGHGTAIAAAAAGAGGAGHRLGVAPRAWILPIDIQENLRSSESRIIEDDPRMRFLPAAAELSEPLRSLVWAQAAGVVYAVREKVRVLTCAWGPLEPHWILHDVFLYAEDNCVLSVCASLEGMDGADSPLRGYPSRWRADWLREQRVGSGDAYDAWAGELYRDFFQRPLRGILIAGTEGEAAPGGGAEGLAPDIRAPAAPGLANGGVPSAVSNPRNDGSVLPDRRIGSFSGAGIWAGLAAGTALLISEQRPDLEPLRVRNSILDGAKMENGSPRLWIPGALRVAGRRPPGACMLPDADEPQREAIPPLWQRVRIKAERKKPTDDPDPPVLASPGLP